MAGNAFWRILFWLAAERSFLHLANWGWGLWGNCPLCSNTTAPVLLPFCILPFLCLPFYCPPFPLSSKKWPPRAARSGEHYKYIKHLGVFLGKEMCLVATILAISVGIKTSIWIFWTKMVLSSDYIMWDDLLIQCRSVTCSYDTGLGTRPVWGQLLLCAP